MQNFSGQKIPSPSVCVSSSADSNHHQRDTFGAKLAALLLLRLSGTILPPFLHLLGPPPREGLWFQELKTDDERWLLCSFDVSDGPDQI